jgi:DNA-binding transcriptional regulator YbjK
MSRRRNIRILISGITTHVLALAKPPSVSRGRVDDMRREKVGLGTQQMTA